MLAVIECGSKQYLIEEGTIIDVESLNSDNGKLTLDKVLMLNDGKSTQIGQPFLSNVSVKAEVLEDFLETQKKLFLNLKEKLGIKKLKLDKITAGLKFLKLKLKSKIVYLHRS